MSLDRKHGWILAAIAGWNVFIWITFARNLSAAYIAGEDRPTGYWVAHTVLIVVGLLDVFLVPQVLARKWRSPLE